MTNVQPVLPDTITGMDRDGETVKTSGGTWRAKRYVAVKRLNGGPAWGACMNLEFTPEYPADATKIVLVQTVRSLKGGAFFYLDSQTTEDRSFGGASIDQVPESRSPIYADNPAKATGGLGTTPLQQGAGEHGHHYQDRPRPGAVWKVKTAWLRDTPHFRDVTEFSSQAFETTALAVEGKDQGAYYGSVRWGWRLKHDGDVLLDPLTIESQGSASEEFQLSARKWNGTRTSTGTVPQQLPSVAPRVHTKAPLPPPNLSPGTPFNSIGNDDL